MQNEGGMDVIEGGNAGKCATLSVWTTPLGYTQWLYCNHMKKIYVKHYQNKISCQMATVPGKGLKWVILG